MPNRMIQVAVVFFLAMGLCASQSFAGPDKKDKRQDTDHRHQAEHDRGSGDKGKQAAFEKQKERFEQTHAKRLAKLNRIRELAVEKGNDKLVAKVDGLIKKHHQKHAKRMKKLEERRNRRQQKKDRPATGPHDNHSTDRKAKKAGREMEREAQNGEHRRGKSEGKKKNKDK